MSRRKRKKEQEDIGEKQIIKAWAEYSKILDYNKRKNIYADTRRNYNFYNGNHWEGLESGTIQPVMKNLIKLLVKDKISRILNNQLEPVYVNETTEQDLQEEGARAVGLLTILASKTWEMEKIHNKTIQALKDSCINSEGLLYLMTDKDSKGDVVVKAELLDKINVFYADEENDVLEDQDFIIVRQTVSKHKLMEQYPDLKEEDLVDEDEDDQASINDMSKEGTIDRVIVLTKFFKKKGKVWSEKSVKYKVLEEEANTGLTRYPIAHMLWERKKNDARGIGLVKSNIPNQIEYNRIMFRNSVIAAMYAYPKLIYNKDFIKNPKTLTEIGSPIAVEGSKDFIEDVNSIAKYLQPAPLSIDTYRQLDVLENGMREAESTGDLATADVNPERASGRAILAVQFESNQILNEQVENFKEFIENIARILLEIWIAYFKKGLTLHDPQGVRKPLHITNDLLKMLSINVRIEVTPKHPYDINIHNEVIDNLLVGGHIKLHEWVEALDDNASVNKKVLRDMLKRREAKDSQIAQMQEAVNMKNQMYAAQLKEQELAAQLASEQVQLEEEMELYELERGDFADEMSQMPTG